VKVENRILRLLEAFPPSSRNAMRAATDKPDK
jgi:hypothetical protein